MDHENLSMLLTAAFAFATLGAVTKIALTLILRRRTPHELPGERAALDERLTRIESIVEATALEVERIGEGQRFTTKLLQERGVQPVAPQRLPGQSITPH
jgi:hypothetical protein